jgi:CheY-like chemotaxis protein
MSTKSCPACVLLVEDDERLREGLASFLEERGYPTVAVENPQSAIDALGTVQRPCLMLVDPMTLRIDWRELFSALGREDRVATLPMVLVSTSAPSLFSRPVVAKRLIHFEILFRIVQEHCCSGDRDPGKGLGGGQSVRGGEPSA